MFHLYFDAFLFAAPEGAGHHCTAAEKMVFTFRSFSY